MRIVFFVYEGLTTLDVVGPHEVLARLPGVEAVTASPDGGPVTVDTGTLGLVPTASISDIESADVLVVPGGVSGTFAAAADPAITGWVRDISAGATWTASVCTGSLILGAAGVLAGRRATTHWAAIDLLERYGAIPTRQRIVIDGDVITGRSLVGHRHGSSAGGRAQRRHHRAGAATGARVRPRSTLRLRVAGHRSSRDSRARPGRTGRRLLSADQALVNGSVGLHPIEFE